MEAVLILIIEQKSLKARGKLSDHKTVMFGSGDVSILIKVCKNLNEVFVTKVLPSTPIPPIDSVTQVGSPANNSSYSGVRKCLTILSLMTN